MRFERFGNDVVVSPVVPCASRRKSTGKQRGSPCITMQEHMETTSGRPKSVTGKFRMTFSPEILPFSLKPVKFKPSTAGKSTELPALN